MTTLQRHGPVALVTGASSGIGQAFAANLAARGFDLVLVAREAGRLGAVAADLAARHGVRAVPLALDLARPDAAEAIAAATADEDVGLVVSNAGFSLKGDHAAIDPDALTALLMVNSHIPLQLTRAFIPRLRARGRGGMILTSSVEALIGCPWSAAYSASKALVRALGEALWAELRPDGIDVLTLCPGATDTPALARMGLDVARMPHVMSPAEVAAMALDRIAEGPTLISSEHYRDTFDRLLAMPRDQALLALAARMR
jgi:short-subunit dehydrogenase